MQKSAQKNGGSKNVHTHVCKLQRAASLTNMAKASLKRAASSSSTSMTFSSSLSSLSSSSFFPSLSFIAPNDNECDAHR